MKRIIAFVIVAVLVVIGIVAVVLDDGTTGEREPVETKAVKGKVLSIEECGIPTETFGPVWSGQDAEGISTILSAQYKKDDPLVEMAFMLRKLDGSTIPMRINGIEFDDDEEEGSVGLFPVKGVGLRLDVQESRKEMNFRSVLLGHSYTVQGFTASSKAEKDSSRIGDRTFIVPPDLQPNQVYRVKLILRDEIYQKELLAAKAIEKPFWR